MRGSRGLRGRKNILILLVAAALVVGLFPVGAFAFAPDETDDAPELATVEDTADLETGTASESTTADDAAAEMAEDPDTADGRLIAQADGLGTPTITVTPPVAGTTSATAPVVTAESGAGYSVTDVKWCDKDGSPLADTERFKAGQTYYLSAQLNPTAESGTESYFATTNVTCNGGTVECMFNGTRKMDGRLVISSLGPVISVKAVFVDLCVGSNTHNGDVKFTYSYIGVTTTHTISGSTYMKCGSGSTLTLTAVPKENYEFIGWFSANYDSSGEVLTPSGDALSTDPTYTITVDSSMEQNGYCAVFEHNHTWGAWTATASPTCTAPGVETRACTGCDKKETREVAALGHDWGAWTQTKAPTCTEAGMETRTCKREASHTETREVAALGHEWGEGKVTTEPTCAQAGVHTFTCTRCGNTKTEAIPTLEHTWGAWEVVKEATETEDGEEARSCSRCGEKETRVISHLGVQYRSTGGDGATWSKGSGETLAFTFKRNVSDDITFAHFTGIKVDDVEVDASNYSAAAGSVVVTLNASYLEGLSAGDHTITALFDDGDSASATFTVAAAGDKPAEDKPADGKPSDDKSTDGKPEDKPASDTPSGDKGPNAAKPANAAPASGTAARKTLPATDDPTHAWSGLLAAVTLCGAAAFVAGSRMRPARSRRKHTRS